MVVVTVLLELICQILTLAVLLSITASTLLEAFLALFRTLELNRIIALGQRIVELSRLSCAS